MRKRTQWKAESLSSEYITDADWQVEKCHVLRDGQASALMSLLEQQRWSTRWYGPELTQEQRDAWVDDAIARLMGDDCSEEIGEETCTEILLHRGHIASEQAG